MKKLLAPRIPYLAAATPLFVDDGNRAAASAIARMAARAAGVPSPLVLVGPPDSGKTRLLAELRHDVVLRGGAVIAGTMRDWIRRVRGALRDRSMTALAEEIERADLLVIDEFHRLGTGTVTRDFLVARIADRIANGRHVAVAARHHPSRIRRLTDRGVSLLLGGLVLDVAQPGPEVRRRFLAALSRGRLTPEAIERLCASVAGGLRALEVATRSASRPAPARAPSVAIDRVAVAVARELGVPAAAILGRRRTAGLVRARIGFVLAAHLLGARTDELATALDGRSAAAVRRMEVAAAKRVRADASLAASVDRVVARLRSERSA